MNMLLVLGCTRDVQHVIDRYLSPYCKLLLSAAAGIPLCELDQQRAFAEYVIRCGSTELAQLYMIDQSRIDAVVRAAIIYNSDIDWLFNTYNVTKSYKLCKTACKYGNLQALKILHSRGYPMEQTYQYVSHISQDLSYIAGKHGHINLFEWLDLNTYRITFLYSACIHGILDAVKGVYAIKPDLFSEDKLPLIRQWTGLHTHMHEFIDELEI